MRLDILLDTNTVIYYAAKRLPMVGRDFVSKAINKGPHISLITYIEASVGQKPYDELTLTEVTALQKEMSTWVIVQPGEPDIVSKTIELRREGLKLPDAIIVATAFSHGALLVTSDTKLSRINGLETYDPMLPVAEIPPIVLRFLS